MTKGNEIGGSPIRASNKRAAFWILKPCSVSLSSRWQRLAPGHFPCCASLLCSPQVPMFAFLVAGGWVHRPLGTPSPVPGELGLAEMEGAVVLGTSSQPFQVLRQTDTHTDSEARQLYWGDTWHFWVWALHANIKGRHVTSSQSAEGRPGSGMGSSALRCSRSPGCFCQTLGEIHPQL